MNTEEHPPSPQDEITAVIEALNTQLMDESAENAAHAFNLGCILSGLLVGVIVILVWLWRHWIAAFMALLLTGLIAVSISTYIANRARANSISHIYEQNIQPQIQDILQQHKLSHDEWQALVAETLSEEAPLRLMVSKPH
jgi:hypothetical protein